MTLSSSRQSEPPLSKDTHSELSHLLAEEGLLPMGNASQVSDGAAVVLCLGLPIVGKYVTATVVCVPPRIMDRPRIRHPRVLGKAGISKTNVDFWDIRPDLCSYIGMQSQRRR